MKINDHGQDAIRKQNLKQDFSLKKKPSNAKIIIYSVIVVFAVWFLISAFDRAVYLDTAPKEIQRVDNQVATDAEQQFYIAKRQGDKMQIYMQSGMVCAAYLQAKDEVNYDKWKSIQDSCAKVVGLK